MILNSLKLDNNLRVEIVDGEDIVESYKNRKYVSSCMSNLDSWEATKFYTYVKDLKLFRIMRGNDLVLRSLLWTVGTTQKFKEQFTLLDTVYATHTDGTPHEEQEPNPVSNIRNIFASVWPQFADKRNTAKKVYAKLGKVPRGTDLPYTDTFLYITPNHKLLCNDNPTYTYRNICDSGPTWW
jgi:hypothetical protein